MRQLDRYLAKLVKSQLNKEKADELPVGVTVQEIVNIAKKSHMECILLSALINANNIGDDERKALRPIILRNMIKSSTQIQAMKELEELFEKNKVTNQPMKGAILRFIYPSPELRQMSDLDILIAKDDMDKAIEVLESLGYSLKESVKHHHVFTKKPFMVVEAHHAMYDKTVDKKQENYFSNFSRTTLKEGRQYTHVFGLEDFYVYMMAHMAKHFYQTGCGIRHLVDIYVYLNRYGEEMNREYIDSELEKCGIYTFTKHMEKLAFSWLDETEADELYSDMFLYMIDSGIYGKDENGIWNKLSEDEGDSVKRGHLRRWYFFPPLYYMSEYYPYLAHKPWLLPWAWFVRGVEGILKNKGKRKRKMIEEIDMDNVSKLKRIYRAVHLDFHR